MNSIHLAFLLAISGFVCFVLGEQRYKKYGIEDRVTRWLLDLTAMMGVLFVVLVFIWISKL